MFPRNLTFFRFPTAHDLSQLAELLPEAALKPIGPLELSTSGFISPFGRGETDLVQTIGSATRVTLGIEEKILPAATVNELLARKLAEIEQKEGRKVGGRARKRIKDDLLHELLPRALTRSRRIDAVIFTDLGVLAVDTSSRKAAEHVASELRRALGSFPAVPPVAGEAPRAVLTGYVGSGHLPGGLELGDECALHDVADDAKVRISGDDLRGEEVARHLEAGKQVTRLGLSLHDHLSFTLGEDLVVRRLKFLDGATDLLADVEADDLRAELDARFALLVGEVRGLFRVLEAALRIQPVEG